MVTIANFIFNNIILVVIGGFCYYLYTSYKGLKNDIAVINNIFTKTLDSYLKKKIDEAITTTDRILKTYGKEDTVSTEINRLLLMIEKGVDGTINDKVATSNAINKFKLSKKIDFERYPYLLELNKLGTFTDEDMNSVDNGVAIARREYNSEAFRYNEKTSGLLLQLLTKVTKLPTQFIIFDAPKTSKYEEKYEVFEETDEPEINTLTMLNRPEGPSDYLAREKQEEDFEEIEEVVIEHSDEVLKPKSKIE